VCLSVSKIRALMFTPCLSCALFLALLFARLSGKCSCFSCDFSQVEAALAEVEEYHKRAILTTKVAADASAAALEAARATAADLAARGRARGGGGAKGGDKDKEAQYPPVMESALMLEIGDVQASSSSALALTPEVENKAAAAVPPESKEDDAAATSNAQVAGQNMPHNEKGEEEDDASESLWLEEGGVLDDQEDELAVIARLTGRCRARLSSTFERIQEKPLLRQHFSKTFKKNLFILIFIFHSFLCAFFPMCISPKHPPTSFH